MIIKEVSEDRIVIYKDEHTVSLENHEQLILLMKKLEESNLPILNINVSYNSVTVQWDIFKMDVETVVKKLKELSKDLEKNNIGKVKKTIIEIPVCYDPEFAIDLDKFDVSLNTLIKLHTEREYRVYMIGFLPGFMYLGGLNEKLYKQRLDIPRKRIDKGSVGIAGGQTGVYPQNAPGGWNIIGKTPIEMVKEGIPIVRPGDYVKFYSISIDEYWRFYNDKDN